MPTACVTNHELVKTNVGAQPIIYENKKDTNCKELKYLAIQKTGQGVETENFLLKTSSDRMIYCSNFELLGVSILENLFLFKLRNFSR